MLLKDNLTHMNERINMNEKTKKEGKKDCGSETGLKYIKSPTTQNYKNI